MCLSQCVFSLLPWFCTSGRGGSRGSVSCVPLSRETWWRRRLQQRTVLRARRPWLKALVCWDPTGAACVTVGGAASSHASVGIMREEADDRDADEDGGDVYIRGLPRPTFQPQ